MKLLSIVFLVVISLVLFSENEPIVFTVPTPNEGSFKVKSVYQSQEIVGYKSIINAPVCEEGVCYDVKVKFYWNLIGGYTHFDTLENFPLTKLDHLLFEPHDYEKLQSILLSEDLKFTSMKASELVSKPTNKGLDAVSGATRAAIKNEVIEGAIYTCHTLWHIANGPVIDSIQNESKGKLSSNLIKRIADYNTSKASYFLLDNLSKHQLAKHIDLVLRLIENGDGYFAKNAFERMPQSAMAKASMQAFIYEKYTDFDYYTRIAILKNLEKTSISKALGEILLSQLSKKINSEQVKIVDLLLANSYHDLLRKKLRAEEELKVLPRQIVLINP